MIKCKSRSNIWRPRMLQIIFTVILIALAARFIDIQIIRRQELITLGNEQIASESIVVKAKRGMVFDRNGRILAQDVACWSLGVYLPQVKDRTAFANKIALAVDMPVVDVAKKIVGAKDTFIYIKKDINVDEYNRLSQYERDGAVLDKEYKRYYPYGTLLSSVIGVTGTDNQGLSGIEYQYDQYLKGTDGQRIYGVNDMMPGSAAVSETLKKPIPGADVTLNIDVNVQYFAAQAIADEVTKDRAKRATCTIIDVKTGAIIAMADVPGTDPTDWCNLPASSLNEKAISINYEPGSVFKAVTSAIGLETRTIDLNFKFNAPGYFTLRGMRIHDGHVYGWINLYDMLRRSSNIGFAQLAVKIGEKKFDQYVHQYGFGAATGIDLPCEESGIVPRLETWSQTTLPTMGFGQGIAVTAIQMANYYTTLANLGMRIEPHVAQKIVAADGTVLLTNGRKEIERVMPADIAQKVLDGINYAVDPDGIYTADIPGYEIGGKTGTAQIASKSGGYLNGQYIYSFAGVLTTNNPRYVVFLSIHETEQALTSFLVAAPVFKTIAEQLIQDEKISP